MAMGEIEKEVREILKNLKEGKISDDIAVDKILMLM